MTAPPTLTGREIAIAATATRALLDRQLAEAGVPFETWVVVNLLGDADEVPTEAVADQLVLNLRIAPAAALAVIDVTRTADLTTGGEDLALTEAGRALVHRIRTGTAVITERLYSDLPSEDLVTTRRILETLTERARAELA